MPNQRFNAGRLIVSLAMPLGAGALGSLFTVGEITTWYADLAKPTWNPPDWLFGPVWSILYLLIGISIYLYWQNAPQSQVKLGLEVAGLQLLLNAFWSILFFGLHNPGLALIAIGMLWLATLLNIALFQSQRAAGLLLVPYWLWITFAAALNYAVYQLNV